MNRVPPMIVGRRRVVIFLLGFIATSFSVGNVKLYRSLVDKELTGNESLKATMASDERFLVVEVAAGLTNQQIMLEEALLLAQVLNRTLILPRVRAHIPAGQALATTNPNFPTQPFDELFDSAHFIRCARENLEVEVVKRESLSNIPPPYAWSNYIHRTWFQHPSEKNYKLLDWPSPAPEGVHPANVAQLFVNETDTPVIKIVMPFQIFVILGEPASRARPCFRPSERLQTMVQNYVNSMPKSFVCLHARTEIDWFRECCQATMISGGAFNRLSAVVIRESRFGLFPQQPDKWTCGNGQRPAQSCYQTPQQIVDTMTHHFSHNTTANKSTHLWIASGSSDQALKPLLARFHVHRTNHTATKNFMDYDMALVERQVCAAASQMWLASGSSFSTMLDCAGTDVIYYNEIGMTKTCVGDNERNAVVLKE